MTEKRKTSIVDVPRQAGDGDLLGLDKHATALTRFIESAETPLTIAIQGEWGSGKTSMMNQLRSVLCDSDDARFYGVWINTWQYALLSDEEVILSRIVSGLTNETIGAIQQSHPDRFSHHAEKVKAVTKAVFRGVLKMGAHQVAGTTGASAVDDVIGKDESDLTVNDLRDNLAALIEDNLAALIEDSLREDNTKDGFVFFIDDLDRIEPVYAVQILELLKNIFNIPNCLFILAIDYDVVVKGLEPKFGKLSEHNEREFRSFFDKIIQLPFSMPVGRYEIDDFIVRILDDVDYLTEQEEKSDAFKVVLSDLAKNSVGRNPRSLKRLTNSLSLIKIFNDLDNERQKKNDEGHEKLMNIGLICCQIAYPYIYRLLNQEPDFRSWNEGTASRLRLAPLEEEEKERLSQAEEFDEEWEQVVYRACQRDPYLSKNANRVSLLLNRIAEQLPDDEDLGEAVRSLLSLSSVTSVEAQDAPGAANVRSGSMYETIEAFIEKRDPKGKNPEGAVLLRMIRDAVLEKYPDALLRYNETALNFSCPMEGSNRKRNFMGIGLNRPKDGVGVSVGVSRKYWGEPTPERGQDSGSARYKPYGFSFIIRTAEEFDEEVLDYIEWSQHMHSQGIRLEDVKAPQ